MQRLLMGKGAKQVVPKRGSGGGGAAKDEMNWEAEAAKRGLPDADEGIATGARVFKFKTERKR